MACWAYSGLDLFVKNGRGEEKGIIAIRHFRHRGDITVQECLEFRIVTVVLLYNIVAGTNLIYFSLKGLKVQFLLTLLF